MGAKAHGEKNPRSVDMTEQELNGYLTLIVEKLKAMDPYKVILFGSHAQGQPTSGSDIDLLVVTNDDFIIKNYEEKIKLHLRISSALRGIMKQVPIDLIVYTKPTYEKFVELGSMFSKEIERKGKLLYERDFRGLVESGVGRS
jgi:predicted nucleotidyltransferase